MEIKISREQIIYIVLIAFVISCIYILFFVHFGETDSGPIQVKGPWGYWNQTSNKSFYLTDQYTVYVGNGKYYTTSTHLLGYWEKLNDNTYLIRWPDSTNETLVYNSLTDVYTGPTGIYLRVY